MHKYSVSIAYFWLHSKNNMKTNLTKKSTRRRFSRFIAAMYWEFVLTVNVAKVWLQSGFQNFNFLWKIYRLPVSVSQPIQSYKMKNKERFCFNQPENFSGIRVINLMWKSTEQSAKLREQLVFGVRSGDYIFLYSNSKSQNFITGISGWNTNIYNTINNNRITWIANSICVHMKCKVHRITLSLYIDKNQSCCMFTTLFDNKYNALKVYLLHWP